MCGGTTLDAKFARKLHLVVWKWPKVAKCQKSFLAQNGQIWGHFHTTGCIFLTSFAPRLVLPHVFNCDPPFDPLLPAICSLVPQPTCCWKWVGGTKGSKRAFFSLTAVFSAKNGSRLKNRTFLESPVCEFSENGFGSKKKLFSRPLDLETVLPPIWGGSPSNLGRFEK